MSTNFAGEVLGQNKEVIRLGALALNKNLISAKKFKLGPIRSLMMDILCSVD